MRVLIWHARWTPHKYAPWPLDIADIHFSPEDGIAEDAFEESTWHDRGIQKDESYRWTMLICRPSGNQQPYQDHVGVLVAKERAAIAGREPLLQDGTANDWLVKKTVMLISTGLSHLSLLDASTVIFIPSFYLLSSPEELYWEYVSDPSVFCIVTLVFQLRHGRAGTFPTTRRHLLQVTTNRSQSS
jgi:hypothetical protein